jgi:PTH1 family peptidyl-tRNA hydrolase
MGMAVLRLVAGLGNPGPEYINTRHNIGFMVLDELARTQSLEFSPAKKWRSDWAKWNEILLVKPLTYMNRSGDALGPLTQYFHIKPEEVLAVVDDVALPLGRLRLREEGSDGGHNGLRSLADHFGYGFPRLRIGVGAAPDSGYLVDHVLGRFEPDEQTRVREAVERATAAIVQVAVAGITAAMNQFNRAENS